MGRLTIETVSNIRGLEGRTEFRAAIADNGLTPKYAGFAYGVGFDAVCEWVICELEQTREWVVFHMAIAGSELALFGVDQTPIYPSPECGPIASAGAELEQIYS